MFSLDTHERQIYQALIKRRALCPASDHAIRERPCIHVLDLEGTLKTCPYIFTLRHVLITRSLEK